MRIIEVRERTDDLIQLLLKVWERSVRATHLFLSEGEIADIKEYVPQALSSVENLVVAEDEGDNPVAFMGIEKESLEMLFIAPKERGKGLGKQLIQFGIENYSVKKVAVNEQNPQAKGFYEHMGFRVYKRTDHDEQGNPYPLLYMSLSPQLKQNYYGSLCTEMYEILHESAPADELQFYLSYAKKGMKILEPLCGSGRFFVPFLEHGFDVSGVDLSEEMLDKLRRKAPEAKVVKADIIEYPAEDKFDYIFIPSGSVSLFTDIDLCKSILRKLKELLAPGGKFVFSVDTVFTRCAEESEYKAAVSVKTKEGFDLILKGKNHYDEKSQTQYSPSVYELYNDAELLQSEEMDFQTHLYRYGEMEEYLRECGFKAISTYATYQKEMAVNDKCEMFLYECSV